MKGKYDTIIGRIVYHNNYIAFKLDKPEFEYQIHPSEPAQIWKEKLSKLSKH